MAPYVDAVLQQKRSRFLIRLSAQLLRWVTQPDQDLSITNFALLLACNRSHAEPCHFCCYL